MLRIDLLSFDMAFFLTENPGAQTERFDSRARHSGRNHGAAMGAWGARSLEIS